MSQINILTLLKQREQDENDQIMKHMSEIVRAQQSDTMTSKPIERIEYCKSSICKDKKHEIIETIKGNKICSHCGTSYGQSIDLGAEWRFYGNEDSSGIDMTRADYSYNKCMPQSCLYTSIKGIWKSTSETGRFVGKAIRWQSGNSKEIGIKTKFDAIQSCCNTHLPQTIINSAKYIFFKISEERAQYGKTIVRKSNLVSSMASAVYFACKDNNKNIRFKELGEWFNIDEHEIQSTVKEFLKHDVYHSDFIDCVSTTWNDLLPRYCIMCGLNKHYSEIVEFVNKANTINILYDKTPQTICAGAIYIVSTIKYGYNTSKKYIVQQCKMSDATLQRCIVCFLDNLPELLF